MPPRGSPPLQSAGQNQKWQQSEVENLASLGPRNKATKCGFQSGGTMSEIAHKWAHWQWENLVFGSVIYLAKKKFFYSGIYLVTNPPPEEKLSKYIFFY